MIVYECKQYTAEWWAARRGIPTSSESHRIITPKTAELSGSVDAYACDLIAEKFDAYYGQHDDYVSAAMKNGTVKEPESRRFYEFQRDAEVKEVGFITTDDGRFGCSPDSLVGEDGGLELKNPNVSTHVKYLIDGGLPTQYRPQVHWCLAVTGRAWWDFCSYSGGLPPVLVRVTPDDYTEKLRGCMEKFWSRYQELLTKVMAQREQAIDDAIARQPVEESYF
jgi:hypothetical protein